MATGGAQPAVQIGGVQGELDDEFPNILEDTGSMPPMEEGLWDTEYQAYRDSGRQFTTPVIGTGNVPIMKPRSEKRTTVKSKGPRLLVSSEMAASMSGGHSVVKHKQMSGGSYRPSPPSLNKPISSAPTAVPPPGIPLQSTVISVNKNALGGGTMINPLEIDTKTYQRPSLSPHPPPPPDASSYHSSPMYGQPILPAHSPGHPSVAKSPQVSITGFKPSGITGTIATGCPSPQPSAAPWAITGVCSPKPPRVISPSKSARVNSPGPRKSWPQAVPNPHPTLLPRSTHSPGAVDPKRFQDTTGKFVGGGDGYLPGRKPMVVGTEFHMSNSAVTSHRKSTGCVPVPWAKTSSSEGKKEPLFGPRERSGSLGKLGIPARMSPLSVDTGHISVETVPVVANVQVQLVQTSRPGSAASPVRLPQVGYSPSASPLSLSPYDDKTFQPLVSPNILNVPLVPATDVPEALDLTKDSAKAQSISDKVKDLNCNVTAASTKKQATQGQDLNAGEQIEPLDLVKNKNGSKAAVSPSKTVRRESLFTRECQLLSKFQSRTTTRLPSYASHSMHHQRVTVGKTHPPPCNQNYQQQSTRDLLNKTAGILSQAVKERSASDSENPPFKEKDKTATGQKNDKEHSKNWGDGISLWTGLPRTTDQELQESSSSPSLILAEEPSESIASSSIIGEDRTDKTVSPSLTEEVSMVTGTITPSLPGGEDTSSREQFADAPEPMDQQSSQETKQGEAANADDEEPDFTWDDYLEEIGAEAVPPTSFKHVELSLESCFVKGMKLEVANKTPSDTYWLASIIMPCGQLLRLRHHGYGDDGKADFWCDAFSSDIHPLGWCEQNWKTLEPPQELKDKMPDWKDQIAIATKNACTVSANILESKAGAAPVDHIKTGMRMEIQHKLDPKLVWLARIVENVGGRLFLRYEGASNAAHDFWLFYLHHRLHPVGWRKQSGLVYKPPPEISPEHTKEEEWDQVLATALAETKTNPIPDHIFKDQIELREHGFQVGWKLEALHPDSLSYMCPATVAKVIDQHYFIVEVDSMTSAASQQRARMCCHGNSAGIFPVNWCSRHGVKLTPPEGWCHKRKFVWDQYLQQTDSKAAPDDMFNLDIPEHDFIKNTKLEAVNPEDPGHICVATVTEVIKGLLWLHLESSPKIMATHIVDVESHDIFPVGWCESNNYPLMPPRKSAFVRRSKLEKDVGQSSGDTYTQLKQTEGSGWCPKIYFNHRCFSGPFLSKGRIAELPKCVGPGPVTLVMKEVLSMLITVAYKSSRVLREIQMEEGTLAPNMHQQVLKAKYKGKSYRATVQLCKTSDQITDFCRNVCTKLECCPNLFSPHFVNGNCPEKCDQLTKTKYTYYYGKKKKKIGRPPGGHSNLENGPRKPGKRGRRRRRYGLYIERKRPSADSEETNNSEPRDEDICDDDTNSTASLERRGEDLGEPALKRRKKRRDYNHFIPPPTTRTTRGIKGPKYSFERRTHQKVPLQSHISKSPKKRRHPDEEQSYVQGGESHSGYSLPPEDLLVLNTNPLWWSVQEVVEFIKTTDCANLARFFKEQEIDGQALLLLTLPAVQDFMELKLGPAVKLCHEVERVKVAFFEQFAGH